MGPGNRSRGDISGGGDVWSGGMFGETENPSFRGNSPNAMPLLFKGQVGATRRVGGVREADQETAYRPRAGAR